MKIITLKNLPCDIFLGAHAGYFDLQKKYSLLQKDNGVNPFVDPNGYKKHIAIKEEQFRDELQKQGSHLEL